MKLNRAQWRAIKAAARKSGYTGDGSRQSVLDYLRDEEISHVKVAGIDLEVKALNVEISEDETQVLITEVQQEAEGDEEEEEEEKADDEDEEEEEGHLSFDSAELNQKVAAMVDTAIRKNGSTNGRPSYTQSVNVSGGQTVEELAYERKIKDGRAVFDNVFMAQMFSLELCRNAAKSGARFGPGADSPEAYYKRYDDRMSKMMASSHPRAKALRAEAKALSSATSNLTAIQYSDTLIRIVEEYGVALKLSPIITMTEMQLDIARRTGGISITYPAENAAPSTTEPSFDNVMLTAKEGMGLSQVSNMALRSARIDLADAVMKEHGQAWAQHIDDAYFKGDGTSTYAGRIGLSHVTGAGAPFGIVATDGGYVILGGTASNTTTAANLATTINRIFPINRQANAVFTGAPTVLGDMLQRLGGASGGTTMVEFQGQKVASYAGFPYIPNFSMSNVAVDSSGDTIDALFGDFAEATKIGYFGGLSMDVSDQRYFDANSVAIRSTLAWDFVIHDVGSATQAGPVVSLWQT